MKKVLLAILAILVVFFALVYLSTSSTKEATATCVVENEQDLKNINFKDFDSVLVAPSALYEGNELKNMMQGHNYRKAWSTPIKVPVVFLDTLKNGLEVTDEGGGMQTHSLKLKAKNGIIYTLRSVNKDPEPLIPEVAKNLGLENIITDGISGQHPFGAILAAALADKAGVLHTHPVMYFVPKQKRLGKYTDDYGNKLYLLEYETESDKNWTSIPHAHEIAETDDLIELKLKLRNKLHIDKRSFIRARLFDMLIGDWDRHAKQWGWVMQQKADSVTAYPLPADRDNAFFSVDGLIPNIITNKNVKPLIRPFQKTIDYMPGLVYPGDVYFLRNTPEADFTAESEILQKRLSDQAIEESFQVLPQQVRKLDEKDISEKIKSRRDQLKKYALEFKEIIDERDTVTKTLKGTDDLEIPQSLRKCFECLENDAEN
ncbi:MAG: hypothetical protein ABGW97_15425 [Christiangramia sp.]|uniref:hypothetical protein n=1 Tax=Christiangramia sp. TaxID=1931228 RepID=UPI0032425026